jgi:hypothetical protein
MKLNQVRCFICGKTVRDEACPYALVDLASNHPPHQIGLICSDACRDVWIRWAHAYLKTPCTSPPTPSTSSPNPAQTLQPSPAPPTAGPTEPPGSAAAVPR